jgi:hypothetical protein
VRGDCPEVGAIAMQALIAAREALYRRRAAKDVPAGTSGDDGSRRRRRHYDGRFNTATTAVGATIARSTKRVSGGTTGGW